MANYSIPFQFRRCRKIAYVILVICCLMVYYRQDQPASVAISCKARGFSDSRFLSQSEVNSYKEWLRLKLITSENNNTRYDHRLNFKKLKVKSEGDLPHPRDLCPFNPSHVVAIDSQQHVIRTHLLGLNISITLGGDYTPPTMQGPNGVEHPPNRVPERLAILVPYRNRTENLFLFLNYMHTFLPLQRRSYRIYLLEQAPGKRFNRAKLFNAGLSVLGFNGNYVAPFDSHFDCFALHDIDKVPSNLNLIYRCFDGAYQVIASQLLGNRSVRYFNEFLGGATLLDRWTLQRINGLSNSFEGWGGEDDDLRLRLFLTNHSIYRAIEVLQSETVGIFHVLSHHADKDLNAQAKYRLTCDGVFDRMQAEGINTVEYKLISMKKRPLFTHLILEI